MYYAQIKDGICYAITQTSSPVDQPDMVQIDSLDETVLGKRWNGSSFVAP